MFFKCLLTFDAAVRRIFNSTTINQIVIESYRKNGYNYIILFRYQNSVYLLRDGKGNVFTNLLEVHTLELRKNLTGNNRMDDWIRLFNAESEEDLDMIRTSNPGILEAIRELKQINLSRALRELHEARLKEKRD